MADSDRIPVSVFQMDLNLFGEDSFGDIVKSVVKDLNKNGANLVKETLNDEDFGPHQVEVYSIFKKYPPRWRGFLEPILNNHSQLSTCENITYSYVCFIGIKNYIFAVAGGYGSTAIARFTKSNFGLDILVRLFKKDSKVIKAIQDRGLTGSILGQTKFYRGDQRFSDENQFGKIFQEIKADLSKQILTRIFGFAEGELTRKVSGCLAKSSFEIKKAVDFKTLLKLIDRFVHILDNMPVKFTLNKVEMISKRNPRNHKLLEELDEWVADQLFTAYKKGVSADIDICHKDFENYLTASCFQIPLDGGEVIEFTDLFSLDDLIVELKLKKCFLEGGVEDFKHSLLLRNVYSVDHDGNELTKGTIMAHIQGEFSYLENSYFLVDGEWYKILPAFIKELNDECTTVLQNTWEDKLIKEPFVIKKRESEFNLKFIGKKGHLVFDTITPQNIEACDIMIYDNVDVHLIHVKKGFNNSIRNLTSQINIAAKRIREDYRTGFEYLEKIELQAKNGRTSPKNDLRQIAGQAFPKGGLSTIFQNKKAPNIIFCLAFVDEAGEERSLLNQLSKFKSNIAKFSLMEVHREIISMGFGFKIIQLKKA